MVPRILRGVAVVVVDLVQFLYLPAERYMQLVNPPDPEETD